jgi:hypothetical protein
MDTFWTSPPASVCADHFALHASLDLAGIPPSGTPPAAQIGGNP